MNLPKHIDPQQPELSFRKTKNGLVPADDATAEWFARANFSDIHVFKPQWKARNPYVHRKFMKMFRIALTDEHTEKSLRSEVLIKSGYFTPIMIDELPVRIPHSVAFDKMDENLFVKVFSDCRETLNRDYGQRLPESFLEDFF